MSGDDLIVAAPWLVFAVGLAVLGWRLAAGRRRRRRGRARAGVRGRLSQSGADEQPVPPHTGPAGQGCAR